MPRCLQYKPSALHATYGVNYYFKGVNGVENRLQFETEVRYCGLYLEKYAIYHLTKHEFVVNRNESDEYIYDIAKKCASVMYPIAILFDKNEKIVYVKPPADIPDRWLEIRVELDRYYKGDTAEEYINKFEDKLNTDEFFTRVLESDLFWTQLFALDYSIEDVLNTQYRLGLFPYKYPVDVECEQRIDIDSYDDIDSTCFNVTQQGQSCSTYLYGNMYDATGINSERYNSEVAITFDVVYEIDKNSAIVEAIEADYEISAGDDIHLTIRMEAYRLEEKPIRFGRDKEFEEMEKNMRKENSLSSKLKRFFNE